MLLASSSSGRAGPCKMRTPLLHPSSQASERSAKELLAASVDASYGYAGGAAPLMKEVVGR
jgi:hypothetical protein